MKKILYVLWMLSVVFAIYCYVIFPQQIAIHYDWKFQVDAYGDKIFVFLQPVILFAILFILQRAQSHYQRFEKTYWRVMVAMAVFMLAMQVLQYLNIMHQVAFSGLTILLGGLLIFIGNYMPKVKYNYFIGIRTPWTYSSELNWYKTHRLGGICFVIAGFLMVIYSFVNSGIVLGLILMATLIPIVYSFIFYLKERKEHATD